MLASLSLSTDNKSILDAGPRSHPFDPRYHAKKPFPENARRKRSNESSKEYAIYSPRFSVFDIVRRFTMLPTPAMDLHTVMERLREKYDPEIFDRAVNIYQLGSRVYGTATETSDWDFMMVVTHSKFLGEEHYLWECYDDGEINVAMYDQNYFGMMVREHRYKNVREREGTVSVNLLFILLEWRRSNVCAYRRRTNGLKRSSSSWCWIWMCCGKW